MQMKVFGDAKDFNPVFSSLNKNNALYKDVQGVIDNLKKISRRARE